MVGITGDKIETFNRPDFHTYLMTLCMVIAQRSLDPATKHGAIAVDAENSILATGYNSPPRGCNDKLIPLTRPQKYPFFLHSEEALICNAARNGIALRSATLFVSGFPCSGCMRKIINAGFKVVYFGPVGSNCVDEKDAQISRQMLQNQNIQVFPFEAPDKLIGLLNGTENYLR